jgi:hypothetical protein
MVRIMVLTRIATRYVHSKMLRTSARILDSIEGEHDWS